MKLSGTIRERGLELYLECEQGNYKIHFNEKQRTNAGDHVGEEAIAEDAPEIDSPRDFPGWVKNGSLAIN